jgi:hypothetical protein
MHISGGFIQCEECLNNTILKKKKKEESSCMYVCFRECLCFWQDRSEKEREKREGRGGDKAHAYLMDRAKELKSNHQLQEWKYAPHFEEREREREFVCVREQDRNLETSNIMLYGQERKGKRDQITLNKKKKKKSKKKKRKKNHHHVNSCVYLSVVPNTKDISGGSATLPPLDTSPLPHGIRAI